MKRLTLITPLVLSLVIPALADDRHGRYNNRHDRRDDHRYDRRGGGYGGPAFGAGVVVAPRPVVVAPAYPVYSGPAYGSNYDPYYDDNAYGNGNGYAAYAPYAPPPLRQEYCPPAPAAGFVWMSGFWRWGGAQFVWSPGRWMRPPHARASWVGGGWYRSGGNYGWRRGYWR